MLLVNSILIILVLIPLVCSYINNNININKFTRLSMISVDTNDWNSILDKNPHGLRLFHPAFPSNINKPLSSSDADEIIRLRSLLGSNQPNKDDLNPLPWLPLPSIGLSSTQSEKELWSRSEVTDAYERYKHSGFLIWAHKVTKLDKGIVLLNHWKQMAVYITEYDPEVGAKGYEMKSLGNSPIKYINWPPLALEMELDQGKWQPVAVSSNIASGEVFSYLPEEMPKAPWEIIFLCLISASSDPDAYQAIFDTGLSPRQGFIAYLRLLDAVQLRLEQFEGVPSYRKISEKTLPN
jgi:hypothetical protein